MVTFSRFILLSLFTGLAVAQRFPGPNDDGLGPQGGNRGFNNDDFGPDGFGRGGFGRGGFGRGGPNRGDDGVCIIANQRVYDVPEAIRAFQNGQLTPPPGLSNQLYGALLQYCRTHSGYALEDVGCFAPTSSTTSSIASATTVTTSVTSTVPVTTTVAAGVSMSTTVMGVDMAVAVAMPTLASTT